MQLTTLDRVLVLLLRALFLTALLMLADHALHLRSSHHSSASVTQTNHLSQAKKFTIEDFKLSENALEGAGSLVITYADISGRALSVAPLKRAPSTALTPISPKKIMPPEEVLPGSDAPDPSFFFSYRERAFKAIADENAGIADRGPSD